MKLYGIQMGDNKWNIDEIPNIERLERLEISNSMVKEPRSGLNNDIEIRSAKLQNYTKLQELVFRNNGLRILNK